jgi:hypothetical protein
MEGKAMTLPHSHKGAARREDESTEAWQEDLKRIDAVARLMDSRFRIPLLPIPIGLDSLVGLVPGVGDAITAAPAAWIIWKARQLGVPPGVLARMALNTGLDLALGAVPLVGDIFDYGFKANLRNAALARQALQSKRGLPSVRRGPAQFLSVPDG